MDKQIALVTNLSKSKGTLFQYKNVLFAFINWCHLVFPNIELDLTKLHLVFYLAKLFCLHKIKMGMASSTVVNHMHALKHKFDVSGIVIPGHILTPLNMFVKGAQNMTLFRSKTHFPITFDILLPLLRLWLIQKKTAYIVYTVVMFSFALRSGEALLQVPSNTTFKKGVFATKCQPFKNWKVPTVQVAKEHLLPTQLSFFLHWYLSLSDNYVASVMLNFSNSTVMKQYNQTLFNFFKSSPKFDQSKHIISAHSLKHGILTDLKFEKDLSFEQICNFARLKSKSTAKIYASHGQ